MKAFVRMPQNKTNALVDQMSETEDINWDVLQLHL